METTIIGLLFAAFVVYVAIRNRYGLRLKTVWTSLELTPPQETERAAPSRAQLQHVSVDARLADAPALSSRLGSGKTDDPT
jgi:hypothetical protein